MPGASSFLGRGYFFYPGGGCREWHTNQGDQPGWRLYISTTTGISHFHHWTDGVAVAQPEHGPVARLFRVGNGQAGEPILWHAISAGTPDAAGERWSVGFWVSDEQADRLLAEVGVDRSALLPGKQRCAWCQCDTTGVDVCAVCQRPRGTVTYSEGGKWKQANDPATGKPYFHNTFTQEVTWKMPTGFKDETANRPQIESPPRPNHASAC